MTFASQTITTRIRRSGRRYVEAQRARYSGRTVVRIAVHADGEHDQGEQAGLSSGHGEYSYPV